jgi:hypothetical protein
VRQTNAGAAQLSGTREPLVGRFFLICASISGIYELGEHHLFANHRGDLLGCWAHDRQAKYGTMFGEPGARARLGSIRPYWSASTVLAFAVFFLSNRLSRNRSNRHKKQQHNAYGG